MAAWHHWTCYYCMTMYHTSTHQTRGLYLYTCTQQCPSHNGISNVAEGTSNGNGIINPCTEFTSHAWQPVDARSDVAMVHSPQEGSISQLRQSCWSYPQKRSHDVDMDKNLRPQFVQLQRSRQSVLVEIRSHVHITWNSCLAQNMQPKLSIYMKATDAEWKNTRMLFH